jgi:hypothetical protein
MYDHLLTEPEKETVERVRAFVKQVPRELVQKMDAGEVDYPREYLEAAARQGLLGLRFPKEYGGAGLRWVCETAAIEEVGVLGSALGCLYSLPSIIGQGIVSFGDERQKQKYLRPTLEGKLTCAEALTEPRGGSDFFGAQAKAVKKGDKFILSGQKRFVVGSQGADYFFVYARTAEDAPDHKAISAFLVERCPEVEVRTQYGLLGTRGGGTGRIVFHDVEVPAENLVGPLNAGALIFNKMMVPERMTSAAGALGTARAALEIAARYSDRRRAFGKRIRKFQAVSFMVADAVTALDSARALTAHAALQADSKDDPRRLVSEAKKHATTVAWEVVNHAMQIMGGIGYTDVYPIERLFRDTRLTMIWTGTNEIMNLLIQHEYYKSLMGSDTQIRNVEDDAVSAHLEDEKLPQ